MIARALLIALALTAACKQGASLCSSDTQCKSGFFCDPATVGVLGFEHNSRDQPVILLWNYVSQLHE